MRSVLGCLLLVLAALSVLELALDGAPFRGRARAQWRAPGHHQTVARTSLRSQGVMRAAPSAALITTSCASVMAAGTPRFASPVLAAVFVPPRA